MFKFHLEVLFHIIGIGSASGLVYKDNSVFVISDNGGYLYEYHLENNTFDRIPLFENSTTENIHKAIKPDFEAITHFENDYYIFGSGSTENRNRMVKYNSETKALKTVDLTNLYLSMQGFGSIAPEDFNIEGVVFNGQTWYFFQRGNGKNGINGIFTVQGKNLENDFTILFNSYKLPKIKGIRSSFTDAVLDGDKLWFLSCAENSPSTYDDGEVLGSFIGCINKKTMKLEGMQKISDHHKFEGITVYKKTEYRMEFLLCEDNDTEKLESDIYRLILPN